MRDTRVFFEGGVFKILRLDNEGHQRLIEAMKGGEVAEFEHLWGLDGRDYVQFVMVDCSKALYIESVEKDDRNRTSDMD